MDRQLAATVIATFRDAGAAQHKERLKRFSARRWQRNFRWLDASGLALYFLRTLRRRNIDDCVPSPVLAQLEQRYDSNQQRTAFLFEEFERINTAFRRAGVDYVNLKGFTVLPDYCPDLSLRYQMDCDFLMAKRDAPQCADVLASLGYSLIVANDHVMEFKTDDGRTPQMRDLYKPRPQKSVELHLCDAARVDSHPDLLRRSRMLTANGYSYPALSPEDMFLSQALHLYRHFRSEWTRISWLLEFRRFVRGHAGDDALWREVGARAEHDNDCALALGVAARMAQKAFGEFGIDWLPNWPLPAPVALWIDRYGDEVLLASFPGSKLYLILERAIRGEQSAPQIRRRLLPRSAPGPVVAPSAGAGKRILAAAARWSYFFFRLRFHLKAGSRYLVASWHWNRLGKLQVADHSGRSPAA
jgi:hypothetical protein